MPKPDDISIFAAAAGLRQPNRVRRQRPKTERPLLETLPRFGSLEDAIAYISPLIADTTKPTRQRLRILWVAASQVRNLSTAEIFLSSFMTAAKQAGLINNHGWTAANVRDEERRFGTQDMEHIIRWALRSFNPFEERSERGEIVVKNERRNEAGPVKKSAV